MLTFRVSRFILHSREEEGFDNLQVFLKGYSVYEWQPLWQTWHWHVYMDSSLFFLSFFCQIQVRVLVFAQAAAVSGSLCWHMWVFGLGYLCVCAREQASRDDGEEKCTWINDVLEQVHKWEGPTVCLQGQCHIDLQTRSMTRMLWLPFVPLCLHKTQYTHTNRHTHTLRTYTLAHECIPDIIQVVVRWLPEHMFLVSLQFHEY